MELVFFHEKQDESASLKLEHEILYAAYGMKIFQDR